MKRLTKCPQIGDRVRFVGNCVVGPCTGVVTAIYKTEEWDGDDPDTARPTGRLAPEHEWHVGMKVDELPTPWCYSDDGKFAPEVSDLTRAA